jgi:hypothetical protein
MIGWRLQFLSPSITLRHPPEINDAGKKAAPDRFTHPAA